jgi:PAS domain S-box-containing protein
MGRLGVPATTWAGVFAMLDLSPDAVVAVDERGTIRHVNDLAAELFRTSTAALEGASIDQLVPSDLRTTHVEDRAAFHSLPSVRTMGSGRELNAQRADGTRFRVDVSLQPLEVEGERLVLAVVRDLTELVRLIETNRTLAADAALLREFVTIASHELRTPLTSVRGFAETLQSGRVTDREQQQDLLGRIVRNAQRQESLISGMLDLSRIRKGRISVVLEEVAVTDAVGAALDAIEGLGDVEVRVAPDLLVRADPLRLVQVLVNLLTNAARYGAPPVALAAERDTEGVALRVTDHGPGVPDRFADALFEAFTQADRGDTREATGLGIGLYITRELVTAMGGQIAYRPNRPTGATFTVRLLAA